MDESVKILLIEDDAVDRVFFERALKTCDVKAKLTIAEDAESGTEEFCREDFTCVFLDYMLPGTDGLSLLKKLHELKADTPIVLITSHGDEKIAVSAMKAGAMDYISKNLITSVSLGQIIRNILRYKEVEKQKLAAENIVKENEKRHRVFFEYSQIFLCTHDLDGNFINVNDAGARSLGYLPEELIGSNLHQIISPTHENLFRDYLKKIMEEKTAMGLMRVMTKNKEERIWMYHNYLYEENEGENYVIGSIQDITDRIKMEEELRSAKMLAEESVKTKEQFLANMSHEIRTPMSAIIGFTNLIADTKLSEEQKEYIDTINYSARNLLTIINDILDFSKIKSGKLTLEEVSIDLTKLIHSIFSTFEPEANKKGIILIRNVEKDVPLFLKGDSVRLNQILMNLFSNAIKFTETGHIKLDIKACGKSNDAHLLEFSVQDTGIGIPANKLQSVFESFTQASSDTTRKYGGTGLGLAIVKDLVEMQGGRIKAENNQGPGTTFTFTISLKEEQIKQTDKMETGKNGAEKHQGLQDVTILLTEDNKFNQLLAKRVLDKMGCIVDIAENGREAVEKIKTRTYDVVLMDIQMPEMDGYEATRFIRTQMEGPASKIPIMAMTAHALNDEGSKCILAGMNDYISKPFEPDVLHSKILGLLSLNKSSQPEIPAHPGEALDLAYLRSVLGDSDDCLKEVLTILCGELPLMTEDLKTAGVQKNWARAAGEAHKMKSSIMTINMNGFSAVLRDIETHGKEGTNEVVLTELIREAAGMSDNVILQIKAYLNQSDNMRHNPSGSTQQAA